MVFKLEAYIAYIGFAAVVLAKIMLVASGAYALTIRNGQGEPASNGQRTKTILTSIKVTAVELHEEPRRFRAHQGRTLPREQHYELCHSVNIANWGLALPAPRKFKVSNPVTNLRIIFAHNSYLMSSIISIVRSGHHCDVDETEKIVTSAHLVHSIRVDAESLR